MKGFQRQDLPPYSLFRVVQRTEKGPCHHPPREGMSASGLETGVTAVSCFRLR